MKPSLNKFNFDDGLFSYLGTMQTGILARNYSFYKIKVNVVPADVPSLLDIDVLDNEELVANNVWNELQSEHYLRPMPPNRKHGRIYLT